MRASTVVEYPKWCSCMHTLVRVHTQNESPAHRQQRAALWTYP
jgi:hypothetical protein